MKTELQRSIETASGLEFTTTSEFLGSGKFSLSVTAKAPLLDGSISVEQVASMTPAHPGVIEEWAIATLRHLTAKVIIGLESIGAVTTAAKGEELRRKANLAKKAYETFK